MAGKRGNGEGSIRKRRDGRWEARITIEGGKGKKKYIYGATRAEVAAKMTRALRDMHSGLTVTHDERQQLSTFLTGWLERVQPTIRPSTHRRYRELLAHVIDECGTIAIAKLTPERVEQLYAKKLKDGLSSTTVHHLHTVLHHALRDALRKDIVARNVCDLVNAPAMRHHEMTVWTIEDAHTFLRTARATNSRYEALFVLAITTGMRQGELLALMWPDVDWQASALQIRNTLSSKGTAGTFALEKRLGPPKTTQSRRRVKLTAFALAALQRHRTRQNEERLALGPLWHDNNLIFPTGIGTPMDNNDLRRQVFLPLVAKAGVPVIRFHDLRHTAATLLMGQSVHQKIVAELLGHSTTNVTMNFYSHVTPDMQDTSVAAMDRLFSVLDDADVGVGQNVGQSEIS